MLDKISFYKFFNIDCFHELQSVFKKVDPFKFKLYATYCINLTQVLAHIGILGVIIEFSMFTRIGA